MKDVLLDALVDSLKVFAVVFIIYIILSFIEEKIANSKKFSKENKLSPLIGASAGLVPQCGLSVVSADMYVKGHITMGTLVAVFIACSDEAIPIMLSDAHKIKWVLPILLIKLVAGFLVGYLVHLFHHKETKEVIEHVEHCHDHSHEEVHVGCCHHDIEHDHNGALHEHLVHPFIHSLKLFIYVFIINIIFGIIVWKVGEDSIASFISQNKYVTPFLSTIVGIIPNCASSVIITELYISSGLSLGACIAGLIMNAGLGMVVLIKNKKMFKKTLIIMAIMISTSLVFGYALCLIFGF